MPFFLVREDITRMPVDAIVNAANRYLEPGGGVCGQIFKAAGYTQLYDYCRKLPPIQTGEAVITPGFALPAKYIIHTAGPVYQQYSPKEASRLLQASYRNSLQLARQNGLSSIAFPLISSGIYGYPKDEALETAMEACEQFMEDTDADMDIYLALFDRHSALEGTRLLGSIESYIDDHYVEERVDHYSRRGEFFPMESQMLEAPMPAMQAPKMVWEEKDFDATVNLLEKDFSQTLLEMIDERGLSDPDVYKKANLDRRLFSKIRTGNGYVPAKKTVFALALALQLNLKETEHLLQKAGYAFSGAQKMDVILRYCITHHLYNVFQVNEILFHYDLPQLGSK